MTLSMGAATVVSNAAVQIVAANALRRVLIIQNTTANAMRIGPANTVAAGSGTRVNANETLRFEYPVCPTDAIFAIREGASDAGALVTEVSKTP